MVNRKLCVIQGNYTDLTPYLMEGYNSIVPIKDCKVFDHIVLALPDLKENRVFEKFAKKMEIDIFYGSVDNVTQRIYQIAIKYECNLIARVLLMWYFLDKQLIVNKADIFLTWKRFLKDRKRIK